MRPLFAAAVAAALIATGFAAHAQRITFPAPVFRGGNSDWQLVLSMRPDASVDYDMKAPQAPAMLRGSLRLSAAPNGQYRLNGTIGAEKTVVQVQIAAVPPGSACVLDNGSRSGANGPFAYAVLVLPAQPQAPAPKGREVWPKRWSGCGNFVSN